MTICYLRRHLAFLRRVFTARAEEAESLQLSEPVAELLEAVTGVLASGGDRLEIMTRLGRAGEAHRHAVYGEWTHPTREVDATRVVTLIDRALPAIDATIRDSQRGDGLYHACNVLAIEDDDRAEIHHLDPMLEGQVAVLSSGSLDADPYSHTPRHAGAQQPGMTGQVKEEILTRRGELGVEIENGRIRFNPQLLHESEFSDAPAEFAYIDAAGRDAHCTVPAKGLAFTLCQLPIVYSQGESSSVQLTLDSGETLRSDGHQLDAATSRDIFARNGHVRRVNVAIPRACVRSGAWPVAPTFSR